MSRLLTLIPIAILVVGTLMLITLRQRDASHLAKLHTDHTTDRQEIHKRIQLLEEQYDERGKQKQDEVASTLEKLQTQLDSLSSSITSKLDSFTEQLKLMDEKQKAIEDAMSAVVTKVDASVEQTQVDVAHNNEVVARQRHRVDSIEERYDDLENGIAALHHDVESVQEGARKAQLEKITSGSAQHMPRGSNVNMGGVGGVWDELTQKARLKSEALTRGRVPRVRFKEPQQNTRVVHNKELQEQGRRAIEAEKQRQKQQQHQKKQEEEKYRLYQQQQKLEQQQQQQGDGVDSGMDVDESEFDQRAKLKFQQQQQQQKEHVDLVTTLTDDNYHLELEKGEVWLVAFVSDASPRSAALLQKWEQIAVEMHKLGVRVGKIDGANSPRMRATFNVNAYPKVYFVRDDERVVFEGKRTTSNLVAFVHKESGLD